MSLLHDLQSYRKVGFILSHSRYPTRYVATSKTQCNIDSMAPSRIRALGDDARSEVSSTRDKQSSGFVASKTRRNGNSTVTTGSTLKDVTVAPTTTNTHHGGQDGGGGVW